MIEIELPDGTILEAPDGADVKTVVQNYQRNRVRANAKAEYERMGGVERFATGFVRPFKEIGYGVKDLTTGLSPEDRLELERMSQHDGIGRFAGEVASFALPGGVVGKAAVKGATLLPRALARLAPAAADVGLAAGVEGLKAPANGESRSDNALEGAVGAGVGRVAGAALRPLRGAVEPASAAAQRMAAAGVPLTPGMAKGGVVQRVEDTLEGFPVVGQAITDRKREALEAWNRNVLNDVVPEGQVFSSGHEGFRQAKEYFDAAYAKVWDRPVQMPGLMDAWGEVSESASPAVARKLGAIYRDRIAAATSDGLTDGRALSAVDDLLRKEAQLASRRGAADEAEAFKAARDRMRALMPEGMSAELARVDAAFRQFAPVRKAGSYVGSGGRGEPFTPAHLRQASNAADRSAGKSATARGEAVMQREANEAADVFGEGRRALPMNPLERAALGIGGIIPGMLARPFYPGPVWRARTEQLADFLRRGNVTPGAIGAAAEE